MPNQDFYERFNNKGSAGDPSTQKRSAFFDRFNAQSNPRYSDELAKRDEEERKRKEQEAIAQFQAKEQEAKSQQQSQNDFLASVGATTPDEQGGQTTFNASGLKNLASAAFDSTMNYSRGVADYAKDNGMGGVMAQTGLGAAKKVGEIASGIAKTGYGLSSASGYSTLRKIVSKVGGEEVAQYIDRNTPEYLKAVDAHIDEDGILNYKAKYDNQIQSVGGAAAEIGSYFMPVTRLGKVATLEKALADIPKVAKALEATPKVVKVGGKLMYEVSKDIVDASLLDAVQGKSWEDIQETAKMAGIGGGALRVGGKLLGSALKSFKENRILDTVTKAIPEITKEEKAVANELLSQGKPLDDVVTDILAKREENGVDIFKGIDDAVDEVPVAKVDEAVPAKTEPTTEPAATTSKMPQEVPNEVKATEVPPASAKAEDLIVKPEQAAPIVKETPENLNKAPEVVKEGTVKANSDFAKRLNQVLPEGSKIDETYDTVNMRKEIAAAEKNATEDPEKLDRLAMGTEKSSTETQTAANIVAVEQAVNKGDYEKAATLLNARFKANNRRGQEISMEQVSAAMNPHERPMKDVMKQRLDKLTNKEKDPVKAQEIVDKKVESTKQEIRKSVKPKIKIERAQKLLDDLICPV